MSTRQLADLEGIQPSIYKTIEYVNVTKALTGFPELMAQANTYFRGMTCPVIPDEEGMVVYVHDWDSFVRRVQWNTLNAPITNLNNVGQDQANASVPS